MANQADKKIWFLEELSNQLTFPSNFYLQPNLVGNSPFFLGGNYPLGWIGGQNDLEGSINMISYLKDGLKL